jgi:hypothetical protein
MAVTAEPAEEWESAPERASFACAAHNLLQKKTPSTELEERVRVASCGRSPSAP